MRQKVADILALGHRTAMSEALRLREQIDERLARNINEKLLEVREATTRAIESLTANEEHFRDPEIFRKIQVKDYYGPNGEPSDLRIPL